LPNLRKIKAKGLARLPAKKGKAKNRKGERMIAPAWQNE